MKKIEILTFIKIIIRKFSNSFRHFSKHFGQIMGDFSRIFEPLPALQSARATDTGTNMPATTQMPPHERTAITGSCY